MLVDFYELNVLIF